MGAKFCFFTAPAKLQAQLPAEAFGPQGSAGGKDHFRVTHRQAVAADAPAVAICDGIVRAQKDSSGGLTLILTPSQTPPFEAPVVSYFIYKGIDRASLLVSDAVLDESASGANDLTKRVAKTWYALNGGALAESKAGLGLDRNSGFLHDSSDPASKVLADGDPVERLFTYPHPTVQLPVASAGDVIGSFGSICGLEVVLLRLGYRPKLGFARSADNLISMISLEIVDVVEDECRHCDHQKRQSDGDAAPHLSRVDEVRNRYDKEGKAAGADLGKSEQAQCLRAHHNPESCFSCRPAGALSDAAELSAAKWGAIGSQQPNRRRATRQLGIVYPGTTFWLREWPPSRARRQLGVVSPEMLSSST